MALPEIIGGMEALRRDNPWPELPAGVEPFYLSLDAGGRHLVTDAIRAQGVTLMLEIGCFLCGSTRQWLDSSPDLEVIGVDPWDGNWSTYIRNKTEEGHPLFAALEDPSHSGHDPAVRQLLPRAQQHPRRAGPVRPRPPALARGPALPAAQGDPAPADLHRRVQERRGSLGRTRPLPPRDPVRRRLELGGRGRAVSHARARGALRRREGLHRRGRRSDAGSCRPRGRRRGTQPPPARS